MNGGVQAFTQAWLRQLTRTLVVLLRVMIPVFLLVSVFEALGWIELAGRWLAAPLGWIGMGPRAAVALLVGLFAGLYAAIGTMASLGMTPAEALPVVLFIQFAHALPMEASVAHQGGANGWHHALSRVALGILAAALAPLLAPLAGIDSAAAPAAGVAAAPATAAGSQTFGQLLLRSLGDLGETLLLLVAILAAITLVVQLLEQSGWLERWSHAAAPWMQKVGWNGEAALPLVTGLFVGLIYGAGVMIERFQRGRLDRRVGREVFLFLGACHSVLEDPFIFVPLGVGPAVLLPVRLAAGALVLLVLAWRRRFGARTAPSVAPGATTDQPGTRTTAV